MALLGFFLYFVHVVCHIRETLRNSQNRVLLGCSSARCWIQLLLLVMLGPMLGPKQSLTNIDRDVWPFRKT
jgi:hypothetical protein